MKHAYYFKNKEFLISLGTAIVFLVASLVINFYAGIYATEKASNAVTDVILSNTRVYDVDGFFVYGPFVFWAFALYLGIREPKRIPFAVKSIALFVLIRSIFISLTHIGPFPTAVTIDSNIIEDFTFGADLFFSGHTGLPYLMALVFWDDVRFRLFFFASAVFFGVIVLMAHLHYTIDVLSAFFITYSIYHIAERAFPKDKRLFHSGIEG